MKSEIISFVIFLVQYGVFGMDLPDDICKGLSGINVPHPETCTKFVLCMSGNSTVLDCEPPKAIFYDGKCVEGDPATCLPYDVTTTIDGSSSTDVSTTTIAEEPTTTTADPTTTTTTEDSTSTTTSLTTTTTASTNSVDLCRGHSFAIIPHPLNCTLFIMCVDEVPYIYECRSPTEVFHDGRCVEGNPVTCEITSPETTTMSDLTTSTTTTTTTTTTTVNSIDLCRGISFGIIPHPSNCSLYIMCINEVPTIYQCGPNTIFHDESCVPGDAFTCEVSTTTEPTTTVADTTTTTTQSTSTTTTTQPQTTTSTATTQSTSTTTTTQPPTTSTTTTTQPSTTTTTTTQPPTTTSTTTTTPSTTTTTPSPTTTTTTTESPTTTITQPTTTTDLPDDFCTGISYGTFPHPNNCVQFIVCVNQNPNVINCTYPTEIFHNGSCVAGDPDTCQPTSSTTAETTSEHCIGNNFRFVEDPDCCYRFFYCVLDVALHGECADGKIFSDQFRGCIDGDREGC